MGFRAALQELIVNSGNEDVCKYYWANEIIIRLDPAEEVERAIAENDLRLIAIRTIGPLDVPGVGEVTESNIPQAGVWIVPGLDDVVVSKVYERLITEFAYSYNTTLK